MNANVIGMAWYTPENYPILLKVFEDAEKFPITYESWLAKAEAGRKSLEVAGTRIIRVDLNPENFLTWCRVNNLKVDSKARMRFVNIVVAQVIKDEADCAGRDS